MRYFDTILCLAAGSLLIGKGTSEAKSFPADSVIEDVEVAAVACQCLFIATKLEEAYREANQNPFVYSRIKKNLAYCYLNIAMPCEAEKLLADLPDNSEDLRYLRSKILDRSAEVYEAYRMNKSQSDIQKCVDDRDPQWSPWMHYRVKLETP